MALAPKTSDSSPSPFDLKSASLTLTTLVLRSTDLALVEHEMHRRYGDAGGLFDDEALLLDLAALPTDTSELDLAALLDLLRRQGLRPLAARGGFSDQVRAAGLLALPDAGPPMPHASLAPAPLPEADPTPTPTTAPAPAPAPAPAVDPAPTVAAAVGTLVVDRPLRSGQQVYARGGDLVLLGPVSFGAEVIADGHIHVYAPLRGRAIAGARGDRAARIFSTCMEPQLVAVAGTYRTIETALPADVAAKPAQVRLDGDSLVIEPLTR